LATSLQCCSFSRYSGSVSEVGSAAGIGVGGGTTVAPELDVVADDEDAGGEQDVGGGAALLGLIGEVRVGERKVVRITERN
jgi:hypothetical protein